MVVPVARALPDAGHEVTIATGGSVSAALAAMGLPHAVMPRMPGPADVAADPELARRLGLTPQLTPLPGLVDEEPGAGLGRMWGGELAQHAAQDMLAATARQRPDLIVREATEYGALHLSRLLDVPLVTLDGAPLVLTHASGVLPWVNRSGERLGLDPLDDPSDLLGGPWISWIPEAWYPTRCARPPTASTVRRLSPAARWPACRATGRSSWPRWARRPRPRSPRALAAGAYRGGAGALPGTAVVGLGHGVDPADWGGARPANVHLASYVQQRLLLSACDVFVTHAGFGSVREALEGGVPMVALPLYAEQPRNALRLAELGAGLALPTDEADAGAIGSAVERILREPSFRGTARRFQRQILGLPGIEQLVADIVALA
jgi:UDP-glucoronosyl and UDP-glucosyl transferase